MHPGPCVLCTLYSKILKYDQNIGKEIMELDFIVPIHIIHCILILYRKLSEDAQKYNYCLSYLEIAPTAVSLLV